jgi:hypothetical protein
MQTAPSPSQPPAASALRRSVALPLLAAALLMLTFVTLPPAPVDLKVDADTSLSAVLNYGQQQGLQFGTDLVSTYGPLGYLIFFYYHPNCAVFRMAVDVALCFTVAAGLCLVAWHLGWVRGGLLLGIFAFVSANLQPRTDLVLDTGFLCWGLLCWVESGRRLAVPVLVFTALAVFAALAKASMIFMAGLSVTLLAVGLLARGNWRVGCGMALGFGLGIPLAWIAAGQHLSHLGAYLNNSLVLVQGYNEALGWEGLSQVIFWAALLALAALVMVITRTVVAFGGGASRAASCCGVMLLWVSALLFLVWKHGVVRGDSYHVVYLFGFLSLLAVALEILPGQKGIMRLLARGLAAVCCIAPLLALQNWFFPAPSKSLSQPLRAFVYNASCLLRPGSYHQRMSKVIEADRVEASLPRCRDLIGRASVDVFGQNQVYALWNGLNYHPRPVFQSYAACNARLMRLNEAFYNSDKAPTYVMFSLGPIDRKFPALEDALLLKNLLFRYEPGGSEGEQQVL